MNDTINTVTSDSSKVSTANVLTKTNAAQEGQNDDRAEDSSVKKESFHELINKAVDDRHQEVDDIETASSGNELPISSELTDAVAEDRRKLSIANFSVSDFLSSQNNLIKQSSEVHMLPVTTGKQAAPLSIDTTIEEGMNGLTASVRQILKTEPEVPGQAIIGQNLKLNSSNTTNVNNGIEKSVLQQSDMSSLLTEQFELKNNKHQLLMSTGINSQQIIADTQSSLLLRNLSAQGSEFNTEALPLLTSASSPGTTSLNLQSIPQVEIVETFARPGWSQAMGKQIVWMTQQNISSAEIRLNPAHLGPIEVRLEMTDDQVSVALSSRHVVVREAMELALPKLREMLDENGLSLADTDISQHSFAEQREHKAANFNRNRSANNADNFAITETDEPLTKQISVSTSMVDYYI